MSQADLVGNEAIENSGWTPEECRRICWAYPKLIDVHMWM